MIIPIQVDDKAVAILSRILGDKIAIPDYIEGQVTLRVIGPLLDQYKKNRIDSAIQAVYALPLDQFIDITGAIKDLLIAKGALGG